MPLLFSRKLKEQSNSEFKGQDKGDLQSRFLFQPSTAEWRNLGLRMSERRDKESILRALSSSAKILALAVLASLKFSKLFLHAQRKAMPRGIKNNVKVVRPIKMFMWFHPEFDFESICSLYLYYVVCRCSLSTHRDLTAT